MVPAMSYGFCANCIRDITPADLIDENGKPDPQGQPRKRSIGRNDGPVTLCRDCDSKPVRAPSDPRGYEAPYARARGKR